MAVSQLELRALPQVRWDQVVERDSLDDDRADLLSPTARSSVDIQAILQQLPATYRHLDLSFDSDAAWCLQTHQERPCFSRKLLKEICTLQLTLKNLLSGLNADQMPFSYLVWGSSLPGIYNLGGDLAFFCEQVRERNVDALHRYAKRCVDAIYLNTINLDLPIMTVALVQGDALGGGFEMALSNDLIIAEEGTKFGLPEVVFNLFPGMGAYSFLSRRLDASRARRMIMSGRLYTAEDLHEMGIVDLIVPRGSGVEEMRRFIESNDRRFGMMMAMAKVGRRCQPITHQELIDVAELWVETTLGLGEEDLYRMERLIAAQDRRRSRVSSP